MGGGEALPVCLPKVPFNPNVSNCILLCLIHLEDRQTSDKGEATRVQIPGMNVAVQVKLSGGSVRFTAFYPN